MIFYGEKDRTSRPIVQIAMPRSPRMYSPGATMHVVARCNNREFYFAAPGDFEILLDHLGEMGSAYEVRLFAYTLMYGCTGSSASMVHDSDGQDLSPAPKPLWPFLGKAISGLRG